MYDNSNVKGLLASRAMLGIFRQIEHLLLLEVWQYDIMYLHPQYGHISHVNSDGLCFYKVNPINMYFPTVELKPKALYHVLDSQVQIVHVHVVV